MYALRTYFYKMAPYRNNKKPKIYEQLKLIIFTCKFILKQLVASGSVQLVASSSYSACELVITSLSATNC